MEKILPFFIVNFLQGNFFKFRQVDCKMWMKKMLYEGNQIHNFISSSGSDFLTSYSSGSVSQKVTVPTVPVPQHCKKETKIAACLSGCLYLQRSPRSHTLRRKSRQVWPSSARRSPSYAGNAIAAAAAARKYERGGRRFSKTGLQVCTTSIYLHIIQEGHHENIYTAQNFQLAIYSSSCTKKIVLAITGTWKLTQA
jgi:hypothetical protein